MMSRKEYWQNTQRSSLRIHLCASERSERAIFWVFNSFTVKKVNFFTINVKFKVILSSKSGGGGDICTGHPPHPKKWGEKNKKKKNKRGCTKHCDGGCTWWWWWWWGGRSSWERRIAVKGQLKSITTATPFSSSSNISSCGLSYLQPGVFDGLYRLYIL